MGKGVVYAMESDIHLLCGIGALTGGAWGALNYYVVSIKLLHLNEAPAKS